MNDKELGKAIESAERYHKNHPDTNVMVVYSEHGGYQGFVEQKNVSPEYQVLYRSLNPNGMPLDRSQKRA